MVYRHTYRKTEILIKIKQFYKRKNETRDLQLPDEVSIRRKCLHETWEMKIGINLVIFFNIIVRQRVSILGACLHLGGKIRVFSRDIT